MPCGLAANNYVAGDPSLTLAVSAQSYAHGVLVFWTFPETNSHNVAHFNVYRSTDIETPTLYRRTAGDHHLDHTVEDETEYHYWVEVVPLSGRKPEISRELNGPVTITSGNALLDLLGLISGDVTFTMLDDTLRNRIDSPQLLADQLEAAFELQQVDTTNLATNVADAHSLAQQISSDIVEEALSRAAYDDALLLAVNQVKVTADNAVASIESLELVVADDDEALGLRVTSIEAEFDGAAANLSSELLAYANGDFSLGSLLTSIQSFYDAANANYDSQITVLTDADSALAAESTWMQAVMGVSGSTFTNEIATESGLNYAIGHQLTTLQAAVGYNGATFTTDVATESGLTESITSSVANLGASFQAGLTTLESDLQTQITTVSDAASTTAGSLTTLASTVGTLDGSFSESNIADALKTTADEQSATATQATRLQSYFFGDKTDGQIETILDAGVLSGQATYADAVQAIAEHSVSLQSQVDNLDVDGNAASVANIDTLLQTLATKNGDGSYTLNASAFTQLTVDGDAGNSQLTTFAESFTDPLEGIIGSQYTLQLATNYNDDEDDVVVGMTLHNFTTGQGENTNQIIFRADQIGFAGTGAVATEYPFVIDQGFVRIDGARIKALSIGRGQVTDILQSDNYSEDGNGVVLAGMQLDFVNGLIKAIDGEFYGTLSANSLVAAGGILGQSYHGVTNTVVILSGAGNYVNGGFSWYRSGESYYPAAPEIIPWSSGLSIPITVPNTLDNTTLLLRVSATITQTVDFNFDSGTNLGDNLDGVLRVVVGGNLNGAGLSRLLASGPVRINHLHKNGSTRDAWRTQLYRPAMATHEIVIDLTESSLSFSWDDVTAPYLELNFSKIVNRNTTDVEYNTFTIDQQSVMINFEVTTSA